MLKIKKAHKFGKMHPSNLNKFIKLASQVPLNSVSRKIFRTSMSCDEIQHLPHGSLQAYLHKQIQAKYVLY
jgi:hypothetical protein